MTKLFYFRVRVLKDAQGFFVERRGKEVFSRAFSDAKPRRAAEQHLAGEACRRLTELGKAQQELE